MVKSLRLIRSPHLRGHAPPARLLGELTAKPLEVLRELVPAATRIAVLVNPSNAVRAEATIREVEAAAQAKSLQTTIVTASTAAVG